MARPRKIPLEGTPSLKPSTKPSEALQEVPATVALPEPSEDLVEAPRKPQRYRLPGTVYWFDPETGQMYLDEEIMKKYLTSS